MLTVAFVRGVWCVGQVLAFQLSDQKSGSVPAYILSAVISVCRSLLAD
jgi:hypothetical protein